MILYIIDIFFIGLYWKRRLLYHFPSLHARPLVTTVRPNLEAYQKKSDDHLISATKKTHQEQVAPPKDSHKILDVNVRYLNYFYFEIMHQIMESHETKTVIFVKKS